MSEAPQIEIGDFFEGGGAFPEKGKLAELGIMLPAIRLNHEIFGIFDNPRQFIDFSKIDLKDRRLDNYFLHGGCLWKKDIDKAILPQNIQIDGNFYWYIFADFPSVDAWEKPETLAVCGYEFCRSRNWKFFDIVQYQAALFGQRGGSTKEDLTNYDYYLNFIRWPLFMTHMVEQLGFWQNENHHDVAGIFIDPRIRAKKKPGVYDETISSMAQRVIKAKNYQPYQFLKTTELQSGLWQRFWKPIGEITPDRKLQKFLTEKLSS